MKAVCLARGGWRRIFPFVPMQISGSYRTHLYRCANERYYWADAGKTRGLICLFKQAAELGLQLSEGGLKWWFLNAVDQLVGVGVKVVQLIGILQITVVNVLPAVRTNGLVAHVLHARKNVVGE